MQPPFRESLKQPRLLLTTFLHILCWLKVDFPFCCIQGVCKETLETMSESDDEVMHEEVMYEEMIMEIIKVEVNCKKALAIINKSIQESNNQEHQYLLELKARVLWYMKKRDNGVLSALGELFDSGVEFRFPVTYLVYGASSHVKEGSESQLKIYRLGLEQAEKKDDKMVDEFKQRLQPLEEAAHRKLDEVKEEDEARDECGKAGGRGSSNTC
ncbi:unnamed protein product [Trifolium pratense]|uniref:Uncharacterized protein n=1 Tax=Trifolium pratense TaxID=57577 RepID=A0ACB0J1H7_TRIPR|nr:unnamed protein product [Trifolium pratense]